MECAARRYVTGRTAARGSYRGRPVSAVAAPPPAHAARDHLPVGAVRPGRRGLRNLDEDGHAVYRWLVAGARLENPAGYHPARADGTRSQLNPIWNDGFADYHFPVSLLYPAFWRPACGHVMCLEMP